ncbi:MAG: NADH-quinone oxidoreductase subunit N [Deltaproteobacteria bacterium]|nr:MAG: NADH-quinone oxidoreductase subunit N [Deltaproteobacteria bacterium]
MALFPELVLLAGVLVFFGISLVGSPDQRVLGQAAVFFGLFTFIASCLAFNAGGYFFAETYRVDQYSQFFKLCIGFALAVLLIFASSCSDIGREVQAEYYMFLLLGCLGLMMLVSSVELITLFVSLELSSFALYLMVPMRDDRTGNRMQMEAGIKYLLFGVMATGCMLYGMSLLFGLCGSTSLPGIATVLAEQGGSPAAFVGIVLVLTGFFWKLAVFPFHFWVPDTYEGAANETTAFIATVPTLVAVALLIRFMALPVIYSQVLVNLLIVLALCSMFYGNLSALVQKDVKRILGFSAISHAGFMVIGLLDAKGYGLAVYYVGGYVLMNLACFLVICSVSRDGRNLQVEDLNGLFSRQPVLAFIFTIGLLALAGIPPFIGFTGKLLLLTCALRLGHLPLVVLATLNTAIALYYYLRMIKAALTTTSGEVAPLSTSPLIQATGAVLVLVLLLFGALPSKLVSLADRVVQTIL